MANKRKLRSKKSGKVLAVKNIPELVINQPVYAKITGFCPWPARITHLFGRWCDVIFFGVTARYVIFIHAYFWPQTLSNIVFIFINSECRGINIPLECVTNLLNGQHIQTKFSKRRGFSKAYDEMQLFIDSVKSTKIATASKEKSREKVEVAAPRRSARLNKQQTRSDVRRSARLAKKTAMKKWIIHLLFITFVYRDRIWIIFDCNCSLCFVIKTVRILSLSDICMFKSNWISCDINKLYVNRSIN